MIASMYERRMKAANRIAVVIFLIGIVVLLIDWPDSSDDWFNLISIGILGLLMISIASSSRKKYLDVKDIHIPDSNVPLNELDHLVLKKEVSLFPRLLLFEKSGFFVGVVKPIRVISLLYPLSLLLRDSLILMIPISYGVFNNENNLLFTFKKSGIKQSTVIIKNEKGKHIGTYEQDNFKKIMNITGRLKNAEGDIILPVETQGLAGDFTLFDKQGRQWAHFYHGYFPYEYTDLFSDTENNIVYLSDDLDKPSKRLLIGLISYMFLTRNSR
ncbi:hypothetical protein J2S78_000902 [Salibacterium salarium]|uniref:hypothetical protein n=1 Tax=Salibacterium salarium TaxID=284579 RepID=UPI002785BACE|nr:hypothetical protein [Salibacterium salarium]MDQ0298494.1 hypothetical protein [Salibacterium salarium]